jgi:hypothetical protein
VKCWMIAASWDNGSAKIFATHLHGTNVSVRQDIVVGTATALRAGQQRNCDLIPSIGKDFCVYESVQNGCQSLSASCTTGLWGNFPGAAKATYIPSWCTPCQL